MLDAVAAHGSSLMFGVPTMWVRFAASPGWRELAALRLCVSGSAPLDPSTFAALAEGIGSPVLERYGMTETGMLVSNPYDGERRAGSVGLALPGVEVRLDEREGAGEPAGEILVRGPERVRRVPAVAVGADAFAADSWFRTGDLGRADPDGYLRIVGRSKELIITGGFNVYPATWRRCWATTRGAWPRWVGYRTPSGVSASSPASSPPRPPGPGRRPGASSPGPPSGSPPTSARGRCASSTSCPAAPWARSSAPA